MSKYDNYEKVLVYNFENGCGGIGDCIKYFIFILEFCIKNNVRLYYKKNNIILEKYIKLKYDKMYWEGTENYELVTPMMYYSSFNLAYKIPIADVFYFTNEVKLNSKCYFSLDTTRNYVSIHLRLGDKYLETDKNCVLCQEDTRSFSEDKIFKVIEENSNNNIFFCCDNTTYKLKIKEKYKNIIITNCDVGHTSLPNTTEKQILDAVTEFYILTNSDMIYAASNSGFSIIASRFNNIPWIVSY
jgi:hypothetical protein